MTTSTIVVKDLTLRGFRFKESFGRWDVKFSPYLFISPFFILFGLVGLFPLLYTGWVSLHAWDLIGGQGSWTGFDNFAFVLHQRQFWVALRNTLSIFVISAVPQLIAATAIAAASSAQDQPKESIPALLSHAKAGGRRFTLLWTVCVAPRRRALRRPIPGPFHDPALCRGSGP